MSKIEEIEARIRKAVAAQRDKGIIIISGDFCSDDGTEMCPLTCLMVEEGAISLNSVLDEDTSFTDIVEELLKVESGWAWEFVNGFDGSPLTNEAALLGTKLRKELL